MAHNGRQRCNAARHWLPKNPVTDKISARLGTGSPTAVWLRLEYKDYDKLPAQSSRHRLSSDGFWFHQCGDTAIDFHEYIGKILLSSGTHPHSEGRISILFRGLNLVAKRCAWTMTCDNLLSRMICKSAINSITVKIINARCDASSDGNIHRISASRNNICHQFGLCHQQLFYNVVPDRTDSRHLG